ncbi:MAG: polysaccharide lyase family protein [Acidobacteriota bacterium]|nr:polysaccharide lyase family protein [Acidobacteriota bacterium]
MKNPVRAFIPQILLLLAVIISLCQPAAAASQTVWQIGKFDKSSLEFFRLNTPIPKPAGQSQSDVVYVIGKSKEENDWPNFQPGSSNGIAGHRPHPYTIQFDLPSIPRGLYTLKVALLVERPRVPRLEVAINGHRGLYFQHPVLDYSGGDVNGAFMPGYSADTITAELPTAFLRQGKNELTFIANDDPSDRDDATDCGLYYDALELDQDAGAKFSPTELSIQALPTVFYTRDESGLAELVDVYVRHNFPSREGQAVLTLGKAKYTAKLAAGWDFGEQMAEFAAAEFPAGTKGDVTISMGGHPRRFPVTLDPAKKWNFFLVPHTHVDVGYTDYQAKVAEVQSRSIDEALQMIHDHPDFRFSPDGYWCVRQFLAARTEQQKQLLYQAVKEKKLLVPTVEASLLTGYSSLETLIRSLYPAFEFNQKYGGDADYADITDIPSYSWSYASIMAAAGLKYFAAGSDNYRAPVLMQGHMHEKSPFWWEGPDGGRILMWYSRHYHQMKTLFGLPPTIAGGRDSLPLYLQIYSRPDYKSDASIIYGTQAENTDLFTRQATFVDDWNKVYAYPHLKYSGFSEAIGYIAGQFGNSIPVVRQDGGPYWEDGAASTARPSAVERQTEQRALAAEKFSTLSSLVNPRIQPDAVVLKEMWNQTVLYGEHTWGAGRSVLHPKSEETVGQLATKIDFAHEAKKRVDDVLLRSLAALADYISDPEDTFLVFNPLSWKRSSLVEMDLDNNYELVDLTNQQSVGYEVLFAGATYRHIRFMAQDVPSVGYKAYAIKPSEQKAPQPVSTSDATMENQYYRVVLDAESGAVKSVFDKEMNKELVNTSSPYRFDQYLYVTGADKLPNRAVQYSSVSPVPELTIHGAGNGRMVSVTHQPFGIVAHLESQTVNTPKIETEVILFNGQKRIEFINHLQKTEVYTKEAVYFAFPLAMEHPQFKYEIQNGFVDPSRDQMPGAGKEWFSVQHWVTAEEGGVTAALVPVDASLVCLGDIFRGAWPKEFGQRPGTIFSYVMNNYWDTNYAPGQGGDFTFRYVLTSGNHLQPVGLSRLGWEEMTPAETDQIFSQDKALDTPRPLDSAQGSFVQVDQPNVVLVTWKMAEDGEGTILRFLEVGGEAKPVEVQIPHMDVKSAWSSDAMERKQAAIETSAHGFRFAVKPFQIVTVRLEGAGNVR